MLFFLYPNKMKFILSMALWTVIFALLPVIVIPFKQLMIQYQNWYQQIVEVHHGEDTGINPNLIKPPLSVMGWLKTWFHLRSSRHLCPALWRDPLIITAPKVQIIQRPSVPVFPDKFNINFLYDLQSYCRIAILCDCGSWRCNMVCMGTRLSSHSSMTLFQPMYAKYNV